MLPWHRTTAHSWVCGAVANYWKAGTTKPGRGWQADSQNPGAVFIVPPAPHAPPTHTHAHTHARSHTHTHTHFVGIRRSGLKCVKCRQYCSDQRSAAQRSAADRARCSAYWQESFSAPPCDSTAQDVDTSDGHFVDTPVYFASLGGYEGHEMVMGASPRTAVQPSPKWTRVPLRAAL